MPARAPCAMEAVGRDAVAVVEQRGVQPPQLGQTPLRIGVSQVVRDRVHVGRCMSVHIRMRLRASPITSPWTSSESAVHQR